MNYIIFVFMLIWVIAACIVMTWIWWGPLERLMKRIFGKYNLHVNFKWQDKYVNWVERNI